MSTKNGLSRKVSFNTKIGRFNRQIYIEHKQMSKIYLDIGYILTRYINIIKYVLVFSCVDILFLTKRLSNHEILVQNDILCYLSLYWRPFSVTLAPVKVKSIWNRHTWVIHLIN